MVSYNKAEKGRIKEWIVKWDRSVDKFFCKGGFKLVSGHFLLVKAQLYLVNNILSSPCYLSCTNNFQHKSKIYYF